MVYSLSVSLDATLGAVSTNEWGAIIDFGTLVTSEKKMNNGDVICTNWTHGVGKVGETIIQGGYIVTLANVETAQQYGDFSQAQPGNKFISAELLIESAAATGVNVNPFYVSIKDANGYVYSMTVFGKDPALQSQNDMPIGEKNRGWVTFEVPESATGLTLIYEPISFTDTVRIRFDIGQ